MITIVQSRRFTRDATKRLTTEALDQLLDSLVENPRVGSVTTSSRFLFCYRLEQQPNQRYEFDLYYLYHSKSKPLLLLGLFRRGSKAIADLIFQAMLFEIVD